MEQANQEAAGTNASTYISSDVNSTPKINNDLNNTNQRTIMLIIYTSLCASVTVLSLIRSSAFYRMMGKIATTLHNDMFSAVLRATMNFFSVHDAGQILNRFSNDMAIVDELLPSTIMRSAQMLLATFGVALTIISVNWWFSIQTVLMAVFAVLLGKICLRTSKFVMYMERANRSPLYGHVNATLQGLTTIRAFETEAILMKEFDTYQDLHTSAWTTFCVVTRTFGYWLDILCALFTASIVLTYVISREEVYVGNIGLAITQAISLARMFQWSVRQTGEMENQMTSTERILDYSALEREKDPEYPQILPDEWPTAGKIEFRKVFLFYNSNQPPVLRDLNFTVKAGQKIGVVGRTGAGKSSLINAMFQLSHTEGHVFIDDEDITKLRLHDLRSKISIIPQQPVLISGTLRYNLDPFDKCSDSDIWNTLAEIELKQYVTELNRGLDLEMTNGGSNFSVGQRQLLCLARAILCNNKILIMDEATANIDEKTDLFIQKTIRKKFANCTVITVAHRLNTVIDSDKVLVMEAGKVAEYGHPFILLQNNSGHFHQMTRKTGSFNELYKAAEQRYNREYTD